MFSGTNAAAVDVNDTALTLRSAELMETLFRAMYLANLPTFDVALESLSSKWTAAIINGSSGDGEHETELATLAASLFPAATDRVRVPLLEWPIPSLSLSIFETHVTRYRFPVYAASRYLFSGTHAAFLMRILCDG